MVVSKRCKICALIDADNVSITGEHFGKIIPDLISKICGIEVDLNKANGVLVCQMCIIQLVHADMFVDKLKKAVLRLKKNVKETKPKTPSKEITPASSKKKSILNETVENGDQEHDTVTKTEKISTAPKKPRRKSIFLDVSSDKIVCNDTIIKADDTKFKKIDDMTPIEKTPVKAVKRKPPANTETNKVSTECPTPIKNIKVMSESTREEWPMNLTVEHNGDNEKCQKVKNCILCGKVFHANSELRSHIETAHMGERLKSCPHCSSEFRSKQKYESHVFSEKCKTTIHACQYLTCNKRFKTLHKLEMHMLEKHIS